MKNSNENYITYSGETGYSTKLNLWQVMLNFDNLSKSTWFSVIIGTVSGCIYYIKTHLGLETFSWKDIIRSGEGIIYAVIVAAGVKLATIVISDVYSIKLKDKLFKNGKDKNSETDKTKEDKAA